MFSSKATRPESWRRRRFFEKLSARLRSLEAF